MAWIRTIAGVLLVLAGLCSGQPVMAASDDVYFQDGTFDYYLSKDANGVAKLRVVETLKAVFPNHGDKHGIIRVIPYANKHGDMDNLTMASADKLTIKITRNGAAESINKIQNDAQNRAFIVYVGDKNTEVRGEQTYVLEYEFENVINNFDGYQELYWDTNGTGWQNRFQKLTANLHIEDNLPLPTDSETWCYVGRHGSTNQSRCNISSLNNGISFMVDNLAAGENLTMVAKFPQGTFTVEDREVKHSINELLIYFGIMTIIAIMTIIYKIYDYRRRAKEIIKYRKGLSTPVQYVPMKGVTVAELGECYMEGKHSTIVATILELAVAHKITLVQRKNRKYALKILQLDDITEVQKWALLALTGKASTGELKVGEEYETERTAGSSQDRNRAITKFALAVKTAVREKGLKLADYGQKKAALGTLLIIILVIIISAIFSQIVPAIYTQFTVIPAIVVIIGLSIASARINRYAAYTRAGIDADNYAKGLKEYMKLAEKERLEFLQSVKGAEVTTAGIVKLYERLLPYATIFGLEKSWLKQLEVYYRQDETLVPVWYVGMGGFDTNHFSSDITALSSSMSSMTSSSGSSGAGGGGSSGGGGGGGGGGSW